MRIEVWRNFDIHSFIITVPSLVGYDETTSSVRDGCFSTIWMNGSR